MNPLSSASEWARTKFQNFRKQGQSQQPDSQARHPRPAKNTRNDNGSSVLTGRRHPEAESLLRMLAFLKELHASDRFIAGSDYREKLSSFEDTMAFYRNLESAGTLSAFCRSQGWRSEKSLASIRRILAIYERLPAFVNKENETYLKETLRKEKAYLDHILDPVDAAINLDLNQRKVILSDEDYMLVIAGAGAGKTTTVAAKVRYLVEKKGIRPEEILVVSFTNKAVAELRTRINRNLGIPCPIGTFHATGNTILKKDVEERPLIAEASTLYRVVLRYLCESALREERTIHDLLLFFGTYFDAPYEGFDMQQYFSHILSENHVTMRSEIEEYERKIIDIRSRKNVTIRAEILRSREEVEIANYLYLSGIDYTYEEVYPYYLPGSNKPYTPDFLLRQGDLQIWLEHFGISEDGRNNRYTDEELERYKKAANQKYRHHKAHGSRLIFTYSSYKDGRSREEHLREKLISCGFVLHPRKEEEVLAKLTQGEQNRYVGRLSVLLTRFIENFKTNGFSLDDFDRMRQSTTNVRSQIFLNIAKDCFIEYQRHLRKHNMIDFQDMINESAALLRLYKDRGKSLPFKYIIVDEYQDISRQRFDLVRALREVSDARIIAVGDDWQSIYAFSGSDITLFTQFAQKMGYASSLTIDRTYRNSQELIDIAGGFIQKNRSQISKSLISKKHLDSPVIIYTYNARQKRDKNIKTSGVNYAMAKCIETAVGQILEYAKKEERTEKTILLIGRFGFDGKKLEHSDLFEYRDYGSRIICKKYPSVRITFMTAHASKGLGYDDVIVLNGQNAKYGFPAKIENDPVLSFVVHEDRTIAYAEERRLFYVAMTRTKNRVYFIAPEQNPSEFLLELKRDYKTISLRGNWDESGAAGPSSFKACPICGYPLRYRFSPAYGLRLYICSNEPEVCGFMTNDAAGGKLSIRRCSCCRDGFLIVRQARDGSHFLGCTNYRRDGRGCNNTANT